MVAAAREGLLLHDLTGEVIGAISLGLILVGRIVCRRRLIRIGSARARVRTHHKSLWSSLAPRACFLV
jgi:hypothetical protein